jgi:putative ABC transport system permease protein
VISWNDTFRTALDAVRAHRLRSALTALGILIGIASVVLTVGLGLGAQSKVSDQIAALGSNLLIVSPGSSTDESGVRGGFGSGSTLTVQDATALLDKTAAPDVEAAVPVSTSSQVLTAGEENWTTDVSGTTADWVTVRSRELSSGRFFTDGEVASAASVVVLAADTAGELFGSSVAAVGETVTVSGSDLTVIGVLAETGASGTGASENDQALLPISSSYDVTGASGTSISTLYVEATSEETLAAAYQEVEALLDALHQTGDGEQDFSIATQSSLIETANETNETMTMLLAGVAGISLFVGGIGVMNIMPVSVTERIREIGLRKALGGTPRAIRRQFLVEAGVLGLLGGVAGVSVGVIGTIVLPGIVDQPVSLSGWAVAIALVVSLGLGIGFGVYPASRAARLLPIQALRSD